MKKSKFIKFIAVFFAFAFLFALTAYADAGDIAGGGDFGYDNNDYGGNYGNNDVEIDEDYGNRNGGGIVYYDTSSDSSGGDSSGGGTAVIVIIVIVIIIFGIPVIKSLLSKNNKTKVIAPGALPTDISTLKAVSEYTSLDHEFSESDFKEEIFNLYIRLQNSWQNKNLDDIQPDLSDDFYAQLDRQLDSYRKNGQTNRVERIAVLGVELLGWKQESDNDVMIAKLQTRIVDYVVDDATGNIVRGSNTAEKFMTYEWNLIRSSSRKTEKSNGETVSNCPNCGAPLNLNKSAKCEYCGSIIETDDFDWVLSGIKGLSQRTAE